MTEDERKELIREYHDRTVRWTNQTLSQLSFFNNLLLTISTTFLAFAFKEIYVVELIFTTQKVNQHLTFQVISVSFISLSIMIGILLSLNRLLDFRITRHINHARQRMCEHAHKRMSEDSPGNFGCLKRIALPFCAIYYANKITAEESKEYTKMTESKKKEIDTKFKNMRDIAHNLGSNTWCYTYLQMISFAIAIAFYTASILKQ